MRWVVATLAACVLMAGSAWPIGASDFRDICECIDRAERASQAGDHQAALAILNGLEARHTESYAVRMLWLTRGAVYSRMGEHAQALASFERFIAMAPGVALGHHNRGVVLLALGRAREALEAFQVAQRLRDDPEIQAGITAARSRLAETR
ncbi:MAG: hypothetical protein ACM362_01925 [Candidatus Methylomirabilota bacterium]